MTRPRPSQTVAGAAAILAAIESQPGASDVALAGQLGVSRQRVSQVRRAAGLSSPGRRSRRLPPPPGLSRGQLARRVLAELESSPHLAGPALERLADALRAVAEVARLRAATRTDVELAAARARVAELEAERRGIDDWDRTMIDELVELRRRLRDRDGPSQEDVRRCERLLAAHMAQRAGMIGFDPEI